MDAAYILPIRRDAAGDIDDLTCYLGEISHRLEVVVVDGSAPEVFAAHHEAWSAVAQHIQVDPARITPNGKVGGVMTGVAHAHCERLVIADEDVRYDANTLARALALLDHSEVVRPQNYFEPLPWHARWDTPRSLLNRLWGGDWPGTLAVRRGALLATSGYRGDVLFENLELVRTVRAAGGREMVPLDLLVKRLPPTAKQFRSQRVRQAYDELARPPRMVLSLLILPSLIECVLKRRWIDIQFFVFATVLAAEAGRRRAHGRSVFPFSGSMLAPAWLLERGVCAWVALACRFIQGGITYRGSRLRDAASSPAQLRRQYGTRRIHRAP